MSSPLVFSGVRVNRSLVLCVCFVDRCLSFCPISFGHRDYPFGNFKLLLSSMCFTQLKIQFVLTLLPLLEPKTLQELYSSAEELINTPVESRAQILMPVKLYNL